MTKIMLQPDYVTRPELNIEMKKLETKLTKQQDNHLGAMKEIFNHELAKSVEILSGLFDSRSNILVENLYERMDNRLDLFENRLDAKLDSKLDKKFLAFKTELLAALKVK